MKPMQFEIDCTGHEPWTSLEEFFKEEKEGKGRGGKGASQKSLRVGLSSWTGAV